MGRIRSLKPEFGHHDKLSALPAEVHLFAALLLPYADDYGYFNANPRLVHAACCPLRELLMSIPEILGELQEIGYIELMTGYDGRQYGKVTNFLTHQRVAHPTESKIAPLVSSPEKFVKPPDTFSPDLGTGNREQGTGNREVEQDLDGQVHEIASLHPKIKDAFHLPHDVAIVIAEAIARDGRDLVWAGTKSLSDAVKLWPPNELQFTPSPQKFFRESQYLNIPAFWARSTNGDRKANRAQQAVDDQITNRNAARRAVGLDH